MHSTSQLCQQQLHYRVGWVQFQGTKYPKGCIVVLDSSEILPTFGIIMDIILTDSDNVHFVCEALTTEEISEHLHSFIV